MGRLRRGAACRVPRAVWGLHSRSTRHAARGTSAKRPGFTLVESLASLSLVAVMGSAVLMLFRTAEERFVEGGEEGIAMAEAQSILRAVTADLPGAAAFTAPRHGGVRVQLADGRSVELYQDGSALRRAEAATGGSSGSGGSGSGGGLLGGLIGGLLGGGGGSGGSTAGGGTVTETTRDVASDLAAGSRLSLRYLDAAMNPIAAPQSESDYQRAVAVEVTVVVPWTRGFGRSVRRTTRLVLRNKD